MSTATSLTAQEIDSPGAQDRVLLIHGTGSGSIEGHGESWWQLGSSVRRTLNTAFGGKAICDTEVFRWSGRNSEHDRRLAAAALMERLRALESKRQTYHLIGHSHGGSVIWMALCQAESSGKPLAYLRSWTTLGTPFLKFRPTPANWWLSVAFAVSVAALFDFVSGAAAGNGWSRSTIGSYILYARDLWRLDQFAALFLLPLLWLLLSAILVVSISHAWTMARLRMGDNLSAELEEKTFATYGASHLGLWSPSDEAISGLAATVRFEGDVTPRWQPAQGSWLSRVLSGLNWPIRRLYNAVFASATDELIWDRVSRRLQGNDAGGVDMRSVCSMPCPAFQGWPSIPVEVDEQLVAEANLHAANTLAALRGVLGLSAAAGPNSPNVITGLAAQLKFDELVHTSYYLSVPLQALIVHHVLAHGAAETVPEDGLLQESLRDWYGGGGRRALTRSSGDAPAAVKPRTQNLQLLVGTTLAAFALLLWLAAASLYRFSVAPLTAEYQVQQILTASADVVPSVFGSKGLEWMTALVMVGNTDLATRDASRMDSPYTSAKAQLLAAVSATLRSMGRIGEAETVEMQILQMTRQVTDKQQRGDSAVMLERELGDYGVLREDLLGTDLLDFGREDELNAVAQALVKGGRPELAAKIFEQYLSVNPSVSTSQANLAALEASGQKDLALKAAQAMDLNNNIFGGPLVIAAYAAVGQWDQAESLAAGVENTSDDSRSRCYAALAGLRLQAGDAAKGLEDARAVGNWQYLMEDGARVAAGLAKAGFKTDAKLIALKVIHDGQPYDNPWYNAQELIRNEKSLRAAGAGTETDTAEGIVLSKSVQSYANSMDEEVLGRAVYTLIDVGDLRRAEAYVRSFTQPKARADYLPVVSAAYADAGQSALAEEVLAAATREIAAVPGQDQRSSGYMGIAKAEAHLHRYRLARLAAEKCSTAQDRLNAYAEILEEYSIQADPRRRAQLEDVRARRP